MRLKDISTIMIQGQTLGLCLFNKLSMVKLYRTLTVSLQFVVLVRVLMTDERL